MIRKLSLFLIMILSYTFSSNAQTDTTKIYKFDEIEVNSKKNLDKISESEIDSSIVVRFPFHQPYDVFTLAPGILRRGRDIIVRGGNRNDIDWQIEGISVRDPQTSGYIISTNMNAVSYIKFSPSGLMANTGNARGAIIDVKIKEPETNYSSASLILGTFNTRILDGLFTQNYGRLKLLVSSSLMTSDAILLDSRVPIDYNPYTKVLNSDNIFPTEKNKGVRLNIATKLIYQINEKTKLSLITNHSYEQAENPPLYHNGKSFSPTDIQNLVDGKKIDIADYSRYPFNNPWGGEIDNSGTLIISKIEKMINEKSFIDAQLFLFYTYKSRNDYQGSWFFEQGFGGGYSYNRNNYQYGIKINYFNQITDLYNFNLSSEYRLTDINFKGGMQPTVLDTYGNIRRNFYKNLAYTFLATQDSKSSYYNWPDPNSVINSLVENYYGNYFYLVTILNNNFKFKNYAIFNVGIKNTTTNIGKDISIFDPFITIKSNFSDNILLNASYSQATQITSIYYAFSNPYDPYTYGYEATYDAEGNPNIKPERAKIYEVGLGYESTDISFGLTYYKRQSSDNILMNYAPEIVPAGVDSNIAKHYMQYQNLGSGEAHGLEIKFNASLSKDFKISISGNLFAESKTKTNNSSDYEFTSYNQQNTMNVLILYSTKKIVSQLHFEYGSGLPYRWREMTTDVNGNAVQIKRHNYDKNVDPHIVFNGSIIFNLIPKLSFEFSLMNIQGLLDPLFHWGSNQYVEYRDNDTAQNPSGVPHYAFYSIPRFNFGIKYAF